ncbi:MAG: FecR family protein, partial [Methyloceanibacter sp.]
MRSWGVSAAALLGLCFGLASAIGPAEADKVGVAAAVNPDAFSSLSGSPQSQLNIGKSIFFNERINTTSSGLVQVLLVDGSTFTVGPDSDLVIDKFVYDPKKGTGQIAASFSKGVMRFVGGKISKNDNAVTIKTPAGAMAVRGCIILTEVKLTTQVTRASVTA